MSHLLACTDGSSYAPSVYQYSAWAATRMGLGVKVLHVIDPHRERTAGTDLTGIIGFDASLELTEELVKLEQARSRVSILKGNAILKDAVKQLHAAGLAQVETLHRHGTLVETIEELEAEADLIIIGKRGEDSALAKAHLGRELERVIRRSAGPVLVASREFKPVNKFLVAYDGGPSSLKAIEFIATNPLLKGLRCHLLRSGKVDHDALHELEEAATRLREAGFQVACTAIAGSVEEVITTAVADHEIDLLVMGAYGHSPIRQFILGSTTTTMVRTCLVPVLMFR